LADPITVSASPAVDPVAGEWDQLVDRLGAGPFVRPDWIDAWSKAFGAGTLEILCARRDGALVGVLPLIRRGATLRSPTNYHTPGFAPLADCAAARRALAEATLRNRPRHVSIGFLDPACDGFPELADVALAARYRVLGRVLQRSPYVTVDCDWDTFESRMSKNARNDLRRSGRRLRELGATIAFSDGGEHLQVMLADALAVEARSWKAARGSAITSQPAIRRFYEDVAHSAARRGSLRIAVMHLDGYPLAMELGICETGVHYTLKGSYDAARSRHSPGRVLLHAVLARAAGEGVRRIELLGAADAYKGAWTHETRERLLVEAFDRTSTGWLEWLAERRGRPLARRAGVKRALLRLRRS
jgi:CelD/BcsL family acetyltransferase involved in cellulose biosynthesis